MQVERFGAAQSPLRGEDLRLLRGEGRFTDDLSVEGQAHAAFVRATLPHAEIGGIRTGEAKDAPGVLGVFTADDMRDLGTLPCSRPPVGRDGQELVQPPRTVLATDRMRHVGEPVALVVAETLDQALDAAERVAVDAGALPAVVDVEEAIGPDAPRIWPEAENNVAIDWDHGDAAAVEAAFAAAHRIVRVRTTNNRLAVCAMEPRAAIADYDADTDRYTLRAGSQGVMAMREPLAAAILRIDREKLRILTGDVGGGFGMKTQPYPEYAAILHAAKALDRPVKWVGTRSESFLSDNQARDGIIDGELALDKEGLFLGLRCRVLANMGAYLSSGPGIATRNMAWCLAGVYRTPAIHINVTCLFTNTAPIGAYRGAGRPEASYILERLVDQAAAETGIDPVELRRRNLIRPDEMPYAAPIGQTYDSGEFEAVLDAAVARADRVGFAERRAQSKAQGLLRGIGIACFLEHAGANLLESARLRVEPNGGVTVFSAAQSQGQGHFTSFAQVVAERLGIDGSSVRIVEGDSDTSPPGSATTGSRSMAVCGGAIVAACDEAIETGRRIAAHLLEAAPEDVVYDRGRFAIAGTDRSLGLAALSDTSAGADWPDGLPRRLDITTDYEGAAPTYPNGCHICEVEIDPETGQTHLVQYTGVDDVGRIINQTIVDGQIHGGVAQGAGQALVEHCLYDGHGQLVTGSYMDYCLPRADDLPPLSFAYHSVPCRTNVLGVKGVGESGTIGAIPAVANAIMDALRQAGVDHFDMPATPHRIWRLLQARA